MDYRQIIRDAWNFAQTEKRLMYFYAFLPALVTTIAGLIYVVYQGLSLKRYFAHESSIGADLAQLVWGILNQHPEWTFFALVAIASIGVLYLLYPSFNEGALIQFIARRYNNQEIKMRHGIRYGTRYFFRILEFNGLLGVFSVSALLAYATLILRTLGPEILRPISVVLIGIGIMSLIFTFLFTYARFFIVIDEEGVFSAIGKSTRLVVDHWESTFLMFLILLLIALRIILNILLVIVIPGLIVLLAGLFASIAINIVGYIIAGVIGAVVLYLSGYLGGILSVFTHAVWTITFLKLTGDGELTARDAT